MRYFNTGSGKYWRETHYRLNGNGITAFILLVFILFLTMGAFVRTNTPGQPATENAETVKIKGNSVQSPVKEREARLKAQEDEIKKLAGVKRKIIGELSDKLPDTGVNLEMDKETGAIRFSEADFFDTNKTVIKASGKNCLKKFIPIYMSVLLSPEYRAYLEQIFIEGYTDNEGSYLFNLDLSQKRAYAVATYIIGNSFPDFPYKQEAGKYLAANGRSYDQNIVINGVVDKRKSRRVEFKFHLKEGELLDKIQRAFEGAGK